MSQICVRIPDLRYARTVDVEVSVLGKRHLMNYRVESFDWRGIDDTGRIEKLREFVRGYDEGWELVSIGNPSDDVLPITFRRRSVH